MNIRTKVYDSSKKNNTLINTIIELSTKCNWNCEHCYLPSHDCEGLPKEKLFNLFKELRELGCFDLSLTGGEIFLRPDIMDIISYARQLGFNLTLLSNISLLNEVKIKKLAELHVSLIACTIFSLDSSIHDSITGIQGSLSKTLENVNLIKKYNIPLEIKTVLMNKNINSYISLSEFCKDNGFIYKIDAEVFSKIDGNPYPTQLKLSKEQLKSCLYDIDKIRSFTPNRHLETDSICPVLNNSCSISSNGDVFPCNKFFIKIGNIYNSSLNDIWLKNESLEYLRNLQWKDLKQCSACEINEYCNRCPGIALLEDNDLLGPSSLACEFSNARKSIYCKNL